MSLTAVFASYPLVEQVLLEIGENVQNPDCFKDLATCEPIIESLNRAAKETAMATGFGTESATLTFAKGEFMRPAPTLSGDICGVKLARHGARILEVSSFLKLKNAKKSGGWGKAPKLLLSYGNNFYGVWPVASEALTIDVEFFTLPVASQIRAEFDRALVNAAIADFYASRGDAAQAEAYMRSFSVMLGVKLTWQDSKDAVIAFRSKERETYHSSGVDP